MTRDVRLAQLYNLRNQLDVLIMLEQGEVPTGPTPCEHPEEKRVLDSGLGQSPSYMCLACGEKGIPGTV
jgi:hypothetical protein